MSHYDEKTGVAICDGCTNASKVPMTFRGISCPDGKLRDFCSQLCYSAVLEPRPAVVDEAPVRQRSPAWA